jgi:hypothetical protein
MESRFNSYVIVKRGLSDNQLSEPKVKEIITTNNRTLQMTKVFPETSTIEDVFKSLSPLLQDCTTGISSTIIIYGTSNSGHPWTLHGSPENPGIMNRSINQIFRVLGEDYSVNLSIILIYDEQIFDLQSDEKIKLGIRTKHDGYFVSGLKKVQAFRHLT